jgi:hypothetical protein
LELSKSGVSVHVDNIKNDPAHICFEFTWSCQDVVSGSCERKNELSRLKKKAGEF